MTMKTEQEIKQMVNTCNQYHSCAACPYNPEDISRFIGDRWKGGCPNCDRKLVYAMGKGYGDVSEYKAEIERLRQEVRDTDKMARNSIEQYKNNYDNAFERLKAQGREIGKLKDENEALKNDLINSEGNLNHITTEIERLRTTLGQCNTELNSALESLKSQCREIGALKAGTKQAQIDVLNELKKRARTSYVLDDFILGSVVFSKDIDELIKEVQNAEDKG